MKFVFLGIMALVPGSVSAHVFFLRRTLVLDYFDSWSPTLTERGVGLVNEPVFYGCFNWMIPNLYIKNGCSTKHPLKNGCLVYQEHDKSAYPFAGCTASSGCFGIMRKPHGVEEQDSTCVFYGNFSA